MKSYKDPSFEDRASRAAEAKQKALDKLRAKPPLDKKIVAARQTAQLRREAAEGEKRAARRLAEQGAKAERAAKAASRLEPVPMPPTEAERKLARDARYAARKSRK